jgi:hypothetical protein
MVVPGADLVAVMVHGAVMAVMAGADPDGQSLGGGGAEQGGGKGKAEGGGNELFHKNDPFETAQG